MADTSKDKAYVVTHTMISGGLVAGEVFTPFASDFTLLDGSTRSGMAVLSKDTGRVIEIDLDRLSGLSAVREATDDDKTAAGFPDDGILLGNAPAGQTRIGTDTFANVDPSLSTGGDQSDVGKPRGKKADPILVPAGVTQADPPPADAPAFVS